MYSYDAEYGHTKQKQRKYPFKNKLLKANGHDPCQVNTSFENLQSNKTGNVFSILYFNVFMACPLSRRTMIFFRSLKYVDEEHVKQHKHFFVIHPFSNFRRHWNTVMIFIYIGQFITIPIDLARILKEDMEFNDIFECVRNILNFITWFDVIFNCITGYCIDFRYMKRTVLGNWKIFRHYMCTYLVFDVLSTLVFHHSNSVYLTNKRSNHIFRLILYCLALLKVVRVPTFYTYCRQLYESFEVSTARFIIYHVITYSILFLLLINTTACFSTILSEYSSPEDAFFFRNAYIVKYRHKKKHHISPLNISFMRNLECYIYQATLLMTATGMGVRNPVRSILLEAYVTVLWFIAKFLYWLFVAIVLQLFVASTSSKRKYIEKVEELKEFMNYKQLPPYLKNRLLAYYEFGFQRTYFQENEILNALSGHLRQEINMHSCKKLVENVMFFKNIPTTLFVRIVAGLKYEIFMTNDVIAKCSTTGDEMYFLASGTVAIYTRSGKEICHLDDGNHFGEIAMVMSNELRIASVVAIETCEMYRLDRVDFIRAILPFPDLLEKMQRVAAERLEKTVLMDESTE